MKARRAELHAELNKLSKTTASLDTAADSLIRVTDRIAHSTKAWLRKLPCAPQSNVQDSDKNKNIA